MDNSAAQAYSFAMDLACGTVVPMVLKTAMELDLLEMIRKAGPEGSISAAELAAQLPTSNSSAATMIDRILRLLAAHSVVHCRVVSMPDGGVERRYSLTPLCRFLIKNEDGVSLAPLTLMLQDKIMMETWHYLKDAILYGGEPFDMAHGLNAFEYPAQDKRFNDLFNAGMFNQTTLFMKEILNIYKGFEGLTSLVDVGGGTGAILKMITAKYPSISGINFDLDHVLQDAPSYPGINHVSGDMFSIVPKADAIFMKWILHDWSDAHCQKLLKNCYDALPDDGKLIVVDAILGEETNEEPDFVYASRVDMMMMAFNPGGKERSEKEFDTLAKQAGFKEVKKICCVFHLWIMEFYK